MRSLKAILAFIVLTVLLAVSQMGHAATLYVGPAETYTAIQPALDAGVDGDEIVVRDGRYTGALNKNLDFGGKAITLRSENGQESCIIDCESDGSGFYFHSGEGSGSVVNGFTIQNGNATSGGAIYCFSSSPTITNCTISRNGASYGGGICCDHGSSSTITNCTIRGNGASNGGGIDCFSSSPTITNCTISGNGASYGGGICCDHGSSSAITNCTIRGNNASYGGGIYCNESSPTITNCAISGNGATYGGGFYCLGSSPTITNCTVNGNGAAGYGGGIFSYDSSPIITNCILWGDTAEIALLSSSSLTVSYSDVQGGQAGTDVDGGSTLTWGDGNIDADPLFGTNYHLLPGSPCIDAGDPDPAYNDPDGTRNDMGAFPGTGAHIPLYVGPGETYTAIQPALDAAVNGDEIIVRDGTYTGALNKNLDFYGKEVLLRSENGPENCIIDCEGDGRGFYFIHYETSGSVVNGFTIKNGYANNPTDGGGIYCNESSPTIANCIISGNTSSYYGGGIYCWDSSATITNCTIIGNTSSSDGGGILCQNCSQLLSPTITNCTVSGNTARYGAGIGCWDSSPGITNCTITGNSATSGGGIACGDDSWPVISNCTITGNSANYGGGISCDNTGGSQFGFYSIITLTDCILWGDSAPNGPEIAITFFSHLIASYSDVQGGQAGAYVYDATLDWGEGNIDADPLFVGGSDYHLASGSPCIDAGTDAGVYRDIDGDSRPLGDGYDMGSDEFGGPEISVDSASLINACGYGTDAPSQSFEVWNSGSGTLTYSVDEDIGWLYCDPTSGTSAGEHDTITVYFASSGLGVGSYSATITVSDPSAINTPQQIAVKLDVIPVSQIAVSTTALTGSCQQGSDAPAAGFHLWNSGEGTLSYSITDNVGWLSCNPASGTSTGEQDTINVAYNTSSLAAGTYSGVITISDPNAANDPQTISVSLTVTQPSIELTCVPDASVISRGGTLRYTVTATNNGSTSQTFQYWTNVNLPNGTPYPASGCLFGPVTVTLPAYSNRSVRLSHPIPVLAPLGTYTYNAGIGTYPTSSKEQHFNFQVR